MFNEKLKSVMTASRMSQTRLSELTGIGKSSISQYLSGKNEPSEERKTEIARSLGLKDDYFTSEDPLVIQYGVFNLPVQTAARLMGKSKEFVYQGLRDRVFPFGWAVKLEAWSYFISSVKFTEYTGIEIPKEDCHE